VKEDPKSPHILFVGTEFGLYVSLDDGASWAAFHPNNFPSVSVHDMAFQTRDDALVLATHGRGIWIVDDISPLRTLRASTLEAEATLIPGPKEQQRIEGNGGWANGDAAYAGQNPADGAAITYFQKARQVIGRLKLDILDPQGKLVTTLPASNRKGLNRVVWSMRDDPPQTPPGATIVGNSTVGPRVPPGTYTVRLTKGSHVYAMPLTIVLDRRATFTVADRKLQYAAAKRVSGLFGRMSELAAKIVNVREEAQARAAALPQGDALRDSLVKIAGDADDLRKLIVATKEGGAITGEERLREHLDYVYGAIMSVESKPAPYQLARVDALEHELKDVENSFASLQRDKLAPINAQLKAKGAEEISLNEIVLPEAGGGGRMEAVASGLVGTRLLDTTALKDTGESDERD
jgi:hypothetical protein